MATFEVLPKWCHLLDEMVDLAEHELEGSKKGPIPRAPDTIHLAPHSHNKRGGNAYDR